MVKSINLIARLDNVRGEIVQISIKKPVISFTAAKAYQFSFIGWLG